MSDSSSAVCMRTETLMAVGANDFLYLAVLQQRAESSSTDGFWFHKGVVKEEIKVI